MLAYLKSNKYKIRAEAKETLRIGIPIIIAQLLQMSMNFVDTVMAGNLSAGDLAAVAIGGALLNPIIMLAAGTLMAINPIVAHHFGARNLKAIGQSTQQALWLSLILSLPFFFLLRNMDWALHLLDVDPEIIDPAMSYLTAMSWGIFPIFGFYVLRYFNEGLSATKPSMLAALLGLPVNIIGNYILMYGKLGLPALGSTGTGYSSSLAALAMFFTMFIFTARYKPYQRFKIFSSLHLPQWSYIKDIFNIGIPIGLSSTMETSTFALVSLLMGSLGTLAVAGHQVAMNFSSMAFMIPYGLSTAITTRVGQAAGQNNIAEARHRGYVGISLAVSCMIVMALVMFLFPDTIASLYTDDPAVNDIAISLLYMAAIFQISDGFQVSGYGTLRGLKDTKIPMVVNFIAYWMVGIPIGYFLGMMQGIGPQGLWIGLIVGLTIAAVLHNTRFYKMTK